MVVVSKEEWSGVVSGGGVQGRVEWSGELVKFFAFEGCGRTCPVSIDVAVMHEHRAALRRNGLVSSLVSSLVVSALCGVSSTSPAATFPLVVYSFLGLV